MNPFDVLVQLAQENGAAGLAVGIAVLAGVFLLKRGGVVVSGNSARWANVVLSVILSGLDPTNPDSGSMIVSAISVVASSLIFEIFKYLNSRSVNVQFLPSGISYGRGKKK